MLAPFSLTPALDTNGSLIRTASLMVYQAGTTTPAVLYKSPAYTNGTEHQNPIPVDGAGRLPAMYGSGAFKFRLLSGTGSIVWEADGITLTDPPAAEDGNGDNTGLMRTGQMAQFYGTGSQVGYVRMNGRTMGNAASGATERASADTLALYLWLWSQDDSLVVVGGRGQSAQQDYDAGKAITLPDGNSCLFASLDGMGAPATGRYGSLTWNSGGSATRLGSKTGTWQVTLGVNNLPAHNHDLTLNSSPAGGFSVNGTTGNNNAAHIHGLGVAAYSFAAGSINVLTVYSGDPAAAPAQQATTQATPTHSHTFAFSQPDHNHALSGSVGSRGDGQALSIANPIMLVTTYLKL